MRGEGGRTENEAKREMGEGDHVVTCSLLYLTIIKLQDSFVCESWFPFPYMRTLANPISTIKEYISDAKENIPRMLSIGVARVLPSTASFPLVRACSLHSMQEVRLTTVIPRLHHPGKESSAGLLLLLTIKRN